MINAFPEKRPFLVVSGGTRVTASYTALTVESEISRELRP